MADRYGITVKGVDIARIPIVVCIDSTDITDKTNYTVDFPFGPIRDVISIELVKAVVPNPDNANYLVLKLTGMDNLKGNSNTLLDSFCTLERSVTSGSPLVYYRHGAYHDMAYTYRLPSPKQIGSLQIKFSLPNGGVPDFGVSNHLLVFEIHSLTQPPMPSW